MSKTWWKSSSIELEWFEIDNGNDWNIFLINLKCGFERID